MEYPRVLNSQSIKIGGTVIEMNFHLEEGS
jgi:hypothetical protein